MDALSLALVLAVSLALGDPERLALFDGVLDGVSVFDGDTPTVLRQMQVLVAEHEPLAASSEFK